MRAFLLLALLSLPAFAQKVIILELDGDSKDKLRAQIEEAVRASGAIELISLKDYKAAAAKKKMTGAAAMTPVGVARAAKVIAIDAAVGGEVSGGKYNVVIYDRTGGELWTKSLKVTKGLLSDDFAGKLARAITAAAQQGAAKPQDEAGGGEQTPEMSTGLDLTQTQALATPDLQDRVRAVGGPISQFVLDIWAFIATTHGGLLQIEYPAIHDACCVAALIDPSIITTEKADIRVETAGRWTKGMTVCNFEKMGGKHHFGGTASEQVDFRHTVAMTLDHPKFCDLIVDAVERLTSRKA